MALDKEDMVPGSGNNTSSEGNPWNPWQKDAELNVTAGSFDKNSDKQADINIPVNFHRNTLTSITNGDYTLVEGIDYTVTNSSITLNSSYLTTLENGSYTLNFNFSSGNAGSFTVTVTDSTPDTDDTGNTDNTDSPTTPENPEVSEGTAVSGKVNVTVTSSSSTSSNTISPSITITALEDNSFDLSKLKIRYYYTNEGNVNENIWLDTAAMKFTRAPWYADINSSAAAKIYTMAEGKTLADTYAEFTFNSSETLDSSADLTLSFRIAKEDWSQYDQSNDYSYNDGSKILVYYEGEIINSIEP